MEERHVAILGAIIGGIIGVAGAIIGGKMSRSATLEALRVADFNRAGGLGPETAPGYPAYQPTKEQM